MAITIAIAEGKTIAKATAEGKLLAKATAADKILAEVLGPFNVKNFEWSYLLSG